MQPPAKSNNAWVKGCAIGCGVLAALSLLALILILVLSVAVGKRVANVVGVLTGPVDASNSYLGAYRAGDNTVDLACSASDNSAIIAKLDDAKGAGSLSRYYLDHSSIVNGTARVTGTVSFSDSDKYARLTLRKHGSEWKVCDIDVSMSTTVESNTTALP